VITKIKIHKNRANNMNNQIKIKKSDNISLISLSLLVFFNLIIFFVAQPVKAQELLESQMEKNESSNAKKEPSLSLNSQALSNKQINENDNQFDPARFGKIATLQILDKNTAKSLLLDFNVGVKKSFNNLDILVHKCWLSPPDRRAENKILIEVFEKKNEENSSLDSENSKNNRIFYGWLFSSSPSISSLEHPIYDIVAIKCKK